jgi:nucleotide-binding universal stress UspA family protein
MSDDIQSHRYGGRHGMKNIQRIMACIDLSEYSKLTMEFATALSRGFMAKIIVLNVVNIRDIDAVTIAKRYYPDLIDPERYTKKIREERYQNIHRMVKKNFASDLNRMDLLVHVGIPFKTILQVAESKKVDVLVLGNKGRGNVFGTLLGTTAEKVFRHSAIPVLSVRDRDRFRHQR